MAAIATAIVIGMCVFFIRGGMTHQLFWPIAVPAATCAAVTWHSSAWLLWGNRLRLPRPGGRMVVTPADRRTINVAAALVGVDVVAVLASTIAMLWIGIADGGQALVRAVTYPTVAGGMNLFMALFLLEVQIQPWRPVDSCQRIDYQQARLLRWLVTSPAMQRLSCILFGRTTGR